MPDPLIIKIVGDNSGWNRSVASAKQGAKSAADEQGRQAARGAKEMVRQAKIAADGEARERKRATNEAIKEFDRLAKENNRQAAESIRAAKRGADAAIAEAKRSADAIAREAQKQAAAQVAAQRQWERQNVISIGSLQNAGLKHQEKMRAEAEKSAKAMIASDKRWAASHQSSFSASSLAAHGLSAAVGSVVGQLTAFTTLQAGVRAIAQMWDDMRRDAYEAAHEIAGVREELLELAALKGHLGDTTTEMRAQTEFRAKTLQTAPAARAFQSEMLNVGQANIGPLISQGEFDKAMTLGGQFQAAEGGDAATHGKLMGIIPALVGKHGITGAETAATEQKFFNLMQKGGFSFSSGASQLIDKQGLITSGAFKDPARMVATLAALSVGSSPLEAGTHLEHLVEGTTGAFDKMRKGHMDGETITQSAYLKSLGAKLGMDPLEMGKLIAADVNQATESGGAGFDPINYLQHRGYMNQQARMAILTLSGQAKLGQLGMFEERAASPTGLLREDIEDPNYIPADKRLGMFRNTTTAANRQADLAAQLGRLNAGGGAMEYAAPWEKAAFGAVQSRDKSFYGKVDDWKSDWLFKGKSTIYQEQMDAMVDAARAKGKNVRGKYNYSGIGGINQPYYDLGEAGEHYGLPSMWESNQSRSERLVGIAGKLGLSGDDVMRAMMERQARSTEGSFEEMKRIRVLLEGRAPVAPVVPARPAAAGRRP